jgi:WD40 repeat protein
MNGNTNSSVVLSHPRCTKVIRSVTFTDDNEQLISSCDDGSIWVWNIKQVMRGQAAVANSNKP